MKISKTFLEKAEKDCKVILENFHAALNSEETRIAMSEAIKSYFSDDIKKKIFN